MCHFMPDADHRRIKTVTEKALEQFRYVVENFPRTNTLQTPKPRCSFASRHPGRP